MLASYIMIVPGSTGLAQAVTPWTRAPQVRLRRPTTSPASGTSSI